MLGLYHRKCRSYWEGGGSDSEYLLATGKTEKELRDRWNAVQKKQCIELGYRHESYHYDIDPPFLKGTKLTFSGSTRGGCASVSNTITIKEIPQWDEAK